MAAGAQGAIYSYNFNNIGVATTTLNGKDNWVATGLDAAVAPEGGAPHPGDGLCVSNYGGTAAVYGTRLNNGNWSYSVSGSQPFYVQYDFSIDYALSAYLGYSKLWLTNSVSGRKFGFGLTVKNNGTYGYGYYPFIGDALSAETVAYNTVADTPRPGYRQVGVLRLEVDPAAGGGEGLGDLLIKREWLGETNFTAIPLLQNINMKFLTANAMVGPLTNGLRVETKVRVAAMDNFEIGAIPEPATLTLLVLGGLGLLARRRRR